MLTFIDGNLGELARLVETGSKSSAHGAPASDRSRGEVHLMLRCAGSQCQWSSDLLQRGIADSPARQYAWHCSSCLSCLLTRADLQLLMRRGLDQP